MGGRLAGTRNVARRWNAATLAVAVTWVGLVAGGLTPAARAPVSHRKHRVAVATSGPVAGAPSATKVVTVSLSRIPSGQLKALVFLCHVGSSTLGKFDLGVGENVFGPAPWKRLTLSQRAVFQGQWAAAEAASEALMTPDEATAAGYVQAAPFNSGVGAHWIKWSLVAKRFDPARPSMLLFDGLPGHEVRLVGFAYWVQSARQPAGFAGPNDRWHRHAGLCFTKSGWLAEQGVRDQAACNGYWLNGQNLWMLHAWVVPTFPNRWGRFAPTNPALCPPPTKEIISCQ